MFSKFLRTSLPGPCSTRAGPQPWKLPLGLEVDMVGVSHLMPSGKPKPWEACLGGEGALCCSIKLFIDVTHKIPLVYYLIGKVLF